jgi:DNA-binding transcriptional regulator PaaX
MFAQLLKRKGFVRLQDSVFIAPSVDEEEINFIRHQFEIEDHVNIFICRSSSIDDDSKLREKFNL